MIARTLIVLSALAAAGCHADSPEAPDFELRNTMSIETRGLMLYRTGARGHAGMYGMSCAFDVSSGEIGADYDPSDDSEDVQDVFGDITVVVDTSAVYMVTEGDEAFTEDGVVPLTDVREGRLWDGGLAALRDTSNGCQVQWVDLDAGGDDAVVTLDDTTCHSDLGLAIGRDDGAVWIGTEDSVVVVTPDGQTADADGAGQLIAWDEAAAALYVAPWGGTAVDALEADGAPRWKVDVGGKITAVSALGDRGAAAIMVEDGAEGRLVILDGWTGEITAETGDVEAPVVDLAASGDGTVMALVRPNNVTFLTVR